MTAIPIKDFCDAFGQKAAAEIIACTQGNISQIISEGRREIFFELQSDGTYSWYELKRNKKRSV